jgi:hypothetical protein
MAKTKTKPRDKRRKVTLSLSIKTDTRLSALARMHGRTRSEEAEHHLSRAGANVSIMRDGKEYAPVIDPDAKVA